MAGLEPAISLNGMQMPVYTELTASGRLEASQDEGATISGHDGGAAV
jgi:hypothetical protein